MQVRLDAMDVDVQVGDYVLSHAGFAIRRIPRQDIGHTLELYEILLRFGVPESQPPHEAPIDDDRGQVGRDC